MGRYSAILIFIAALCCGCNKPASTPPASAAVKIARQPSSTCADTIKLKMKKNSLSFVANPDSKDDDLADSLNQNLKTKNPVKTDYSLEENVTSHSINKFILDRFFEEGTRGEHFSATLQAIADNDDWPFSLEMSYGNKEPSGPISQFSQSFNVDKNCNLRLVSATRTDFARQGASIRIIEKKYNILKKFIPPVEKTVPLPPGSRFWTSLEMDRASEIVQFKKDLDTSKLFTYGSLDVPLVEVKSRALPKINMINLLSGKVESFDAEDVSLVAGAHVVVKFQVYYSLTSNFMVARNGLVESVLVNEDYWDKAAFTILEDSSSVHIDHQAFAQRPITLRILSDRELDFPNLSAYWEKLSSTPVTSGEVWSSSYVLRGITHPVNIKDSPFNPRPFSETRNRFLQETKAVQISLPAIQEMVWNLRTGFNGTQLTMVKRILALVNQTLTYDQTMLSENLVTRLTTSEILEKKKGVCQHFAVLFAAIARGLGIPTRIITGIKLEENRSYGHAWNEIQLANGVWFPVEPQYTELIFDYSTYLPLAVSAFFDGYEDSAAVAKEFQALRTSFKIESQ